MKTTKIDHVVTADGRRAVYFWNGVWWVHKGWLMPQIGGRK